MVVTKPGKMIARMEEHLFRSPGTDAGSRTFQVIFLTVIFLLGAWAWAAFAKYGRAEWSAHDWRRQSIYLDVVRQALVQHEIPWHITRRLHGTDAYFGCPETTISPQVLLLPHMTYGQFLLMDLLLMYAAGFVGCLLIRRRYRLSAVAFTLLVMLFNFNGHITAHITVGHPWIGALLLPYFALLVLRLAESAPPAGAPQTDVPWAIGFAVLITAIQMQGSMHTMNACCLFLLFFILFNRWAWRTGLLALLFTGLLGAWRFVPAAIEMAGGGYPFRSGYPSVNELFLALVQIRTYFTMGQEDIGGVFQDYMDGWWEYDLYVGTVALAVLLFLGIVVRRLKDWRLEGRRFTALDGPLVLLTVASFSYFWAIVGMQPLPLVNVERISGRFMLIPLLLLTAIACTRVQEALDRWERFGWWRWLSIAALAQIAVDLFHHGVEWSLPNIEAKEPGPIPDLAVYISRRAHPWGVYQNATIIAWLISFATLIVLSALLVRSFRRRRSAV